MTHMSKTRSAQVQRGKKVLAFTQVAVLAVATMVPAGLQAAQLENRSLELGSSAGGATTDHTFTFDIASAGDVDEFRFEYCANDPFPGEPCTAPTGLDVDSATLSNQTGASGFAIDGAATSVNEIVLTGSQNFASEDTVSFEFANAVNPTANNEEFFVRIYTLESSVVVDDAGLASSTAETIEVTARVQETLQFCVYTGANCAEGGSLADLGILNVTGIETANSLFDVSTNARNGVVVQYLGQTLESDGVTIDAFSGGDGNLGTSDPGTEQFGLRIANISDAGATFATASAPFDTANADEYALSDGVAADIAQSSGPIEQTTFTVEYGANVAALTPTGVYNTTVEYIATAQF